MFKVWQVRPFSTRNNQSITVKVPPVYNLCFVQVWIRQVNCNNPQIDPDLPCSEDIDEGKDGMACSSLTNA